MLTSNHRLHWAVFALIPPLIVVAGCAKPNQKQPEKAPRPVSVMSLVVGRPPASKRVTGSVGSWKTEEMGFEVSGRVQWVLEPGEDVEGRIFDVEGNEIKDADGNVVSQGTQLAQLDTERYELALAAAEARVEVARLEKAGIDVSLTSGIAADREAANADLELAQVEQVRNQQLVDQKAGAQADLDSANAALRTAKAKLATIAAQEKQQEAKLNSAIASINQAELAQKDAERDLADTKLYSAFRGQIADVHVVPGSVVAQGTPVLTIQMMNPIKIEVELSAEKSRTIQRRHHVPIDVVMPDGSIVKREAFVYAVDPTGDATTRTFTLTLLVLNKRIEQPIPESAAGKNLARTQDLWRMDFEFLPDVPPGTFYIERNAIRKDERGHFVWKCLNASAKNPLPDVLKVGKLRVSPGEQTVRFLGNWTFQVLTVDDGQEFDPNLNLFVGELIVEDGSPDEWNRCCLHRSRRSMDVASWRSSHRRFE